ncbi:MAG: hypoxanthine phosphoribosyltransferase [Oscillospiraceae bacterium]|jgi:hypoxanthine phosphoribosyltransferase|nr:hypoxanthine phosphoribosyltransferase [Oscillospiraceae bacterium]
MVNDIKKILFDEKILSQSIKKLGKKISEDYKDKNLLMISILKGSIVFMSDLMRSITTHCIIDFMCASSYDGGCKTKGVIKIVKDLDISVCNHDLLIVEDILDSGLTLQSIMNLLKNRNPKSIKICTLLDKPTKRQVDIIPDYRCLEVPDEFIVGYGFDYQERYRNLPFIGVLKQSVYENSAS